MLLELKATPCKYVIFDLVCASTLEVCTGDSKLDEMISIRNIY